MFYVFILSEDSIVYSHSHVLFVQSVRRPWNFVYSPSHAPLVHSVGFIEIMYRGTISSCFYHFIIWAMHVYSVMHAINIDNSRKFHLFIFSDTLEIPSIAACCTCFLWQVKNKYRNTVACATCVFFHYQSYLKDQRLQMSQRTKGNQKCFMRHVWTQVQWL